MYKTEEAIKAYIGTSDKYEWYISTFSNFTPQNFSWKWSWYGFFFGPIYLAYRKCYLESFISIVATNAILAVTSGFGSIFLSLAMGGVTPYLIYRRYISKVRLAEEKSENYEEKLALIEEYGGVSVLARNIMIMFSTLGVLTLMFMVAVLGVLSGL